MGRKGSVRRLRIFTRDKGICFWCRKLCVWESDGSWQENRRLATIDHLFCKAQAQALGMSEAERNKDERVVLACRHCNSGREYREQQRLLGTTTASE